MNRLLNFLGGLVFVFVGILLSMNFVIAQVPTYHQFYGDIYFTNGTLSEQSHTVVVKFDGDNYGETVGGVGNYGYKDLFFVENLNGGEEIDFYIFGIYSGSFDFLSEETTELDLVWSCGDSFLNESAGEECEFGNISAVCADYGFSLGTVQCTNCNFDVSSCSNPVPVVSGPGGSSPGGSSGFIPISSCVQRWVCTGWGECGSDGKQHRTCLDENNCAAVDLKPDLINDCDDEVVISADNDSGDVEISLFKKFRFSFKGFLLVVILIIVVCGIIFFFLKKLKVKNLVGLLVKSKSVKKSVSKKKKF